MSPTADSDATVAEGGAADPEAASASASGTRKQKFGRYDLLESIGQGGMGEVFLAYDSKLHRRVAIKLLRHVGVNPAHASGVRLVREAQALAQLSHPNLVHVYEVGEHGDEVFLVMEFVAGESLSQWLRAQKRSWPEILAVFAGAGAGLAAAHRAGIVHRDFKPANVIIGKDGLARVLDFGIALMGGEHEISAVLGETNARARAAALKANVTERGVVMGTPPYMAPEQHVGARGDARSDQYSFAVALFEALYGIRPFPDDPIARAAAKLRGRIEFPRSDTVPGWLRRPLRRALSVAPGQRFASMNELLAALTPGRVQRWLWLGAAAAVAVAAIGWALFAKPAPTAQCDHVPDELGALWNDERRDAVRSSFLATEAPYAQPALTLTTAALDRHAARWVEIWRGSCEATMVARTQSQQLFDLRMDCLERRLDEIAATTEVLAAADAEVVRNAAVTVAGLTPLEPCTDDDALRDELPPPNNADQRLEIDRIRAELARVRALIYAGRYVLAAKRARELAEEAAAIDYAPLQAEAQYLLGESLDGDPPAAEAAYRAAIKAAGAGRHDVIAARAAVALVNVVGVTQARLTEGESLATAAEAAVARVGDVALSAELDSEIGSIASAAGRYDDAVAAYRRGEQQLLGVLGPEEPRLRFFHNNLGVVLLLQGKLEPALAKFEQALVAGEASVGAEHPDMADYLMNIGNVRLEQRDGERAKLMFARAMKILARDTAQNRRRIAQLRGNMAYADALLGERATAKREAELAAAELRATLGPRHPHVAGSLDLLGFVAMQEGAYEEAARLFAEAEGIVVAALGEAHPLVSAVRLHRGELALERGDATAERLLAEVVERLAQSPGPDHPDHATARALLAEARTVADPAGSVGELTAALTRLRPLDHHYVGRAEFALARALWELPASRPAAREHARSSIIALERGRDPIADRVRDWELAHPWDPDP